MTKSKRIQVVLKAKEAAQVEALAAIRGCGISGAVRPLIERGLSECGAELAKYDDIQGLRRGLVESGLIEESKVDASINLCARHACFIKENV
nr:hypothetical protein [uncultured Cohaesibacter sp.]